MIKIKLTVGSKYISEIEAQEIKRLQYLLLENNAFPNYKEKLEQSLIWKDYVSPTLFGYITFGQAIPEIPTSFTKGVRHRWSN